MKPLRQLTLSFLLLGFTLTATAETVLTTTQKASTSTSQKQQSDPIQAYNNGQYDVTLKAFQPQAEKGDAVAQYYLGAMYYNGQGVKQDYPTSYMWMTLSKESGSHLGKAGFETVSKKMDKEGIAKGKEMVRKWKLEHKNANH